MMIASPIWGALADRWGRKLMVERAMFGGALLLGLMAFVRSAEELVLLRAIQGMITGTIGAANALVASVVPRERSGFAMGLLQVGLGAGVGLGPIIGGAVADAFGYRAAFYVTSALLAVAGVIVAIGVQEDFVAPAKTGGRKPRFWKEWRHILTAPGVVGTYALRFMDSLSRMAFIPILPLFALELMAMPSFIPTEELAFRSKPVIAPETLIRRIPVTEQLVCLEPANYAIPKVGVTGQWLKVRDQQNKEGFVAAWYVKYSSGATAQQATAAAPATAMATTGGVLKVKATAEGIALRKQPVVSDASLIKRLPLGTEFTVTEPNAEGKVGKNDQWLKVKDPGGVEGYVPAWFVAR